MRQTNKIHRLTIKDRSPESDRISTGTSISVELDGKPLNATFLKLEFKPNKVVKALIEMLLKVEEIDVLVDETDFITPEQARQNTNGYKSDPEIIGSALKSIYDKIKERSLKGYSDTTIFCDLLFKEPNGTVLRENLIEDLKNKGFDAKEGTCCSDSIEVSW
jgi:hypothetical protein